MDQVYKHTNTRGLVYYLHTKEVTLRGNVKRQIYYFAQKIDSQHCTTLPSGYEVRENPRNGFVVLAKKRI